MTDVFIDVEKLETETNRKFNVQLIAQIELLKSGKNEISGRQTPHLLRILEAFLDFALPLPSVFQYSPSAGALIGTASAGEI